MMDANILIESLYLKTKDSASNIIIKGIAAGAFIALGGILYAMIASMNTQNTLYKLAGSAAFSIGLILVIKLKAQLFTGNNLLFLNLFHKKNQSKEVLMNWLYIYFTNFIGAIILVFFISLLVQYIPGLNQFLMSVATKKTSYPFEQAFFKAILCNILVCLGVLLGVSLKTNKMRILGIIIPITLFVFLGFEHSIANMFFIPLGLILKGTSFIEFLPQFINNLIPVTIGNILGGLIVSIGIYKFVK